MLSNTKFDNYSFIFIYHLNKNNLPFLEEWIKQANTLGVISIPYSEIKSVKQRLVKYVSVYSPANIAKIPETILKIATKHPKEKIVLVEIGGYSSYVSAQLTNVVLSVEDTFQGHWLQQSNQDLHYPVVSMADTQIKKLENKVIGESIVRTIVKILLNHQLGINLKSKIFSVLSYGGIGSSVCQALRAQGILPFVYDVNRSKMKAATTDGFRVTKRTDMLRLSDIIIGCTGRTSVTKVDMPFLKLGCYLFSGSSKQVEFLDIVSLPGVNESPADREVLEKVVFNGKHIWLAYRGQPINFLDTLKPEVFDLQLATLLECYNYGISNTLKNKVYSLPVTTQEYLLSIYKDDHVA